MADTPPILKDFNSQPHEEADASEAIGSAIGWLFQLTASRRG